jgi:hypothetical protein
VEPGSAAQAAGLRAGDRIVEVNGVANDIMVQLTGDKTKLEDIVAKLLATGGRKVSSGEGQNNNEFAKIAFTDPTAANAAKSLAQRSNVSASDSDELSLAVADWSNDRKGQSELSLKVDRNGSIIAVEFRPLTVTFYPTQLYETISMVLLIFLLIAFQPFRRHDGQVMVLLMVGYAIHRFLNEAIRIEPSYSLFGIDYGLTLSQWISVLILLLAVGLEVYLRMTRPKLPPGPVPLGYKIPQ